MLVVQSQVISLCCEENGHGLMLVDRKRGTHWVLDEKSLVYGGVSRNIWGGSDSDLQHLIPIKAHCIKSDEMVIVYQAGEEHLEVIFTLHQGFVEVRLPVPAGGEIGLVSLPGSFNLQGESLRLLLPIMQGMLWDGRGPAFSQVRGEGSHLGFSMAFLGYLGESGGLLVTAETRDDCRWWFGKEDVGQRVWSTNLQIASLGTLRYERVVRIYVTGADIVAIAKKYRRKVIEQGRFIPWDEKIARRPRLERLFGALMCYIGYCKDDVDYVEGCQLLKAYGFDRALVYPGRFSIYHPDIRMGGVPAINLPGETVEDIRSLGYEVAPWSWLNEALDTGPEIQKIFRRDMDGNSIPNWTIDDQLWYLTCYSTIEAYQRRALANRIPDMSWDHFDVLACVPPMECYAHDHPGHTQRPMTRSEDRQWVRQTFLADQEAGLIVSSENFNDAYSLEYDIGSVKAWPQYGPWPFWPVPLTMLVYHDSLVHSWWEIHSYNNAWRGRTSMLSGLFEYGGGRPRLMAALDALMGCPPDVFPFGAQYGYTGHGKETFLYRYRYEDPEVQIALKAALPVSHLHRRIGKQEMVHFKFLSEDGYLQETAFADGTRVVANFSRDFVGEAPGIDHKIVKAIDRLGPESWQVL